MKKRTILFLCTGNSCRSQMAEGFARRLGSPDLEVFSAGIAAHGLNPRAVEAMREIGIDISNQTSKTVRAIPRDRIHTVVTLCGKAAGTCPSFPGEAERIHWPVEDPAAATGTEEEVARAYRRVRDEIRRRVEEFLRR